MREIVFHLLICLLSTNHKDKAAAMNQEIKIIAPSKNAFQNISCAKHRNFS